ncbi:hypothetical protein BJV78DRAFT_1299804 [Lactifluus subvellereus]|nr:hypothetical protein BJV78DRAFT_1299804 [Lactifluus subvellereus]
MPLYPASMEIQQCEPESIFIEDVSKLFRFVKRYDNTFPEYIRVARMYLFGTPIRRMGAHFRWATPGCIRLRLYSSEQPKDDDSAAVIDDEIDFPLEPNGDLDFHRVKLWWGIQVCTPLEPYRWDLFLPGEPNKISRIAIHNLTAGTQNRVSLLFLPSETNEYRREEQGTWKHELKWQRRALADNPAWYFNRLIVLCALYWLLSLVPGALALLSSAAAALATVARCAHELMLAVPSQARTRPF